MFNLWFIWVMNLRAKIFYVTANVLEKSAWVTDTERYNHAALLQAATRLVATRFDNVAIKLLFFGSILFRKTACHLSEKQQQYLKIHIIQMQAVLTGCRSTTGH